MRILLAHSFYRLPGGEDRHVRDQLELLSRDNEVDLLEESNEALSESLRTTVWMTYSKRRTDQVIERLRLFRPDVVHLHNAYPALGPTVHLAAEELQIPLVMTVHNYRMRCPNGLTFTEGAICRRCERGNYASAVFHHCFHDPKQSAAYAGSLWFHRFILRLEDKVARFVSPSDFVRDRLLRWGISADRVVVIPDFVRPIPAPSALGRFGVFIGRLSAEKGVDVLIRALAKASDPPFRIVGDGPAGVPTRRLAHAVGLRNTEFLGQLSHRDVAEVLQESRYLVMPSLLEETCGLAALEAMAHGRPVLVSSLGALTELVRQENGLTSPPGDIDALAEKIRILQRDDDFCGDAGMRGWDLCRREYSPQVHLSRLDELYTSCSGAVPT